LCVEKEEKKKQPARNLNVSDSQIVRGDALSVM
jgi:hypothetical protein